MTRPLSLSIAALLLLAGSLSGQQGKRCVLVLDQEVKREFYQSEPVPGNVNVFAGGDVRLSCRGENMHIGGDSLTSLGGTVFILTTKAYFRDATISLTGDTITYFKNGEQMQARGNVVVRNLKSGSTLRGPAVDYLRAVQGVRDSAQTKAFLRPTLRYLPARGSQDTTKATPYIIVADRLEGFGSSRLSGYGNVTVERDSLYGSGDSLRYAGGRNGSASLFGKQARLRRTSGDSFNVLGNEVRLGLDDEALRDVRAYGNGHVTNGRSDIKGDSVALAFTDEKLSVTLAWDRNRPATVHNEGYDIVGDSIAIDTPGEKLKELRVFRRGMVQNPVDTAAARATTDSAMPAPRDRDTLWGDRIIASFAQVDSAGTVRTRLQQIEAIGSAASLFSRNVTRNGKTTPSVNYTRADTILVLMKGGDSTGVAAVRAHGAVDGVQLETASLRKAKSDTSTVALPGKRP